MQFPSCCLCTVSLFVSLFACSEFAAAAPLNPDKLKLEYEAQQKALLALLSDEELWNKTDREKELLECLATAKIVKSPELTKALMAHVMYQPDIWVDQSTPHSQLFPVVDVIANVGVSAVPTILEEIAKADPANIRTAGRHTRLIMCLVAIYDDTGSALARSWLTSDIGEELTRQRIAFAVSKAHGKDCGFLKAALEHPILSQKK